MTPQMIVFDTEAELNDFLNTLGVPYQAEEPKEKVEIFAAEHAAIRKVLTKKACSAIEQGDFTKAANILRDLSSYLGPKQETTPAKADPLTGGSVNYYTVKVKGQSVECGDVMDALQLTAHEYNIFKEIWRTANARLGNGKPGHTALYGAEKVAYYANRILDAEKQKA